MENYLQQIKQIISHKTGTDVHEIGEDTYLEEDLNIGEIELLEIKPKDTLTPSGPEASPEVSAEPSPTAAP